MTAPRVCLLTRAGCHLCDDARAVVQRVCSELGVGWDETDVDGVPSLRARHGDHVPVTLVDGREHARFRVEEQRLRRALGVRSPRRLPRRGWRPTITSS